MVNPLARVAMNNIVKKTNLGSHNGLKDRANKLNLKELDVVVNAMKEDKKERKFNSTNDISSEKKVNNLTHKEQDLIIDVIKGETKIKEGKHTVTMLTLDEVVERIKGSR
ncbi:hypothetical protein [Anaerosalibacter massiliensis]|uniref:Uncharacterized protein n=1 Tax=Anaerosalibacter massiliensis TaxID=1347392 RepID=A0A9X2S7Z4_9FIRM|nr:hypothetical protein [Anaerosalibacter massiliensis]MCR2045287.1 hypothetical protein [Anaerosalibacter massiliensis]